LAELDVRFPDPVRFFRAVAAYLRRPVVVPEAVSRGRENICAVCPEHKDGQCQVCTCFTGMKALLATESCPKGQWGEYYSDNKTGLEYSKRP
jgi:hypothetical protein